MALRLAAISLCCSLRARSRSRARRILSAFALFLCCDFSSWQVTTRPLGGEEARLVPAGAGTDLEHGVALVVGVFGEEEVLERRVELGQARLERGQLAARHLAQLGALLAQQRAVLVEVARHALALAPAGYSLLELGALLGAPCVLAPVGYDGRSRYLARSHLDSH